MDTDTMSIATPAAPSTRNETADAWEPLSCRSPPADRLFSHPQTFDFFQAVRLLELLQPQRRCVGAHHGPREEIVAFGAPLGTAFPPSAIADLQAAEEAEGPPQMTVAFLGLTGPSGVLPAPYSQLLLRLARDYRTPEKHALSAWLDLFNHRLVSLFYRAWEKYRPFVEYSRGRYEQANPDDFTTVLLSLAGLERLPRRDEPGTPLAYRLPHALVQYAGLLAQRPRNAANLRALLEDFFSLPVSIAQFSGQWLPLECEQQTQLGCQGALGLDTLVGASIWDRQSKVRICVGPLTREQFERLLPGKTTTDGAGPTLAEFCDVVGFYLGAEMDFDIQLILRGDEVPDCLLREDEQASVRLGWNAWLGATKPHPDRHDAAFAGRTLALGA
jgi:type VI secretion system protein ImpH